MKFAHIVPQDSLELVREATYHMALAHLVGQPGYEAYTKFHKEVADAGAYVIMDNGVIEGAQQSLQAIIERAKLINASEIILPDVFMDCTDTIRSTVDTWNWLQIEDIEINTMIVPHGETIAEWAFCLEQILEAGVEPTCIGIPKVLTKTIGRDARIEVLMELENIDLYAGQEIHFLGCHTDLLEIKRAVKFSEDNNINIRGVDTALCYIHSRNGKTMIESGRPDQAPVQFDITIGDRNLLEENIAFANSEINFEYLKAEGNVVSVKF